jgi:hypothetical protein
MAEHAEEHQHESPAAAAPPAALPGDSLTVACDGHVLDLTVVDQGSSGRILALAPRLQVREGLPVEARVFDEGQVWRVAYSIDEAAAHSSSEAAVELQVVEAEQMGEERAAPRAPYSSPATVRPVHFAPYEIGSFGVHTIDVSRVGVAFECDRAFSAGQEFDMALDDRAGRPIALRVQVQRTAPGLFGRTRAFARIVAIGEHDGVRLDALVRQALVAAGPTPEAEAEPDGPPSPSSLREQLATDRPSGGLARLLRRR